jgi:hypothetical protein
MRCMTSRVALAAALGVMACCGAGAAPAQRPDTLNAAPLFERIRLPAATAGAPISSGLPTWTFSYNFIGGYIDTIVGGDPSGGATTTIPVYVIPVRMKFGTAVFTPASVQPNGRSAQANTLNSPLFKNLAYSEAGTALGTTQYIDAFQRGNFWGTVSSHPGWHTLLGRPTVLAMRTISVPAADGGVGTEYGVTVGLADLNYVNAQLQAILSANPQIGSNAVTIFLMYDTYLTSAGTCCVGGFHTARSTAGGVQSYLQFTYVGTPGVFAQDVSALSHELGEWADDPFVTNNSFCGLLEIGDPLEREANYGGYPYVLGGFTYTLQDMVFMPYFAAPVATSLAGRMSFQGATPGVCANGP